MGFIYVRAGETIVKKGEILTDNKLVILRELNIKPIFYMVKVLALYSKEFGGKLPIQYLERDLSEGCYEALTNIAALSTSCGI